MNVSLEMIDKMDAGLDVTFYPEGNEIRFILNELPIQMTRSMTFDPAILRIGLKPNTVSLKLTNE